MHIMVMKYIQEICLLAIENQPPYFLSTTRTHTKRSDEQKIMHLAAADPQGGVVTFRLLNETLSGIYLMQNGTLFWASNTSIQIAVQIEDQCGKASSSLFSMKIQDSDETSNDDSATIGIIIGCTLGVAALVVVGAIVVMYVNGKPRTKVTPQNSPR